MSALSAATLISAQREFESAIPVLAKNFRYLFRRRWRDRDDLFAEAYACAWKAWRGLIARGRDPIAVGVTGIAAYAVRHTLKGRLIGRGRNSGGRNKMSIEHARAQQLGGYRIISYDSGEALRNDYGPGAWENWVATDHRMGPAEAAAFRIDFSQWLASLPERRRLAAELLSEGRGTGEVAGQLGITAAAVSQTRSYLERKWREYQQEMPAAAN
jgi:DNA-directed RNA polymerase specialized sigma24 family protein